MSETTITILGKKISTTYQRIPINKLKYFEENPRVFSCINEEDTPENEDELQDFIEQKMQTQSSVKNLITDIEKHGGLLERILVRHDTYQVIEGNSRLAVFRQLYKKKSDEKWASIECECVATLTRQQQDAYLAQIHIKGKTQWSAYEKANFSYIREKRGVSIEEIMHILSEGKNGIQKQIDAVTLMKKNNDIERSHFSYYNELVRSRNINNNKNYDADVKNFLLSKIKNMGVEGSDDENGFTAQDLRDKLPYILNKKKELKKFIKENSTMEDAYQNARPSGPLKKVKTAKDKIMDISKKEIDHLEKQDVDALLACIKKLFKEVKRIKKMIEHVKEEKQ